MAAMLNVGGEGKLLPPRRHDDTKKNQKEKKDLLFLRVFVPSW